MQTACGGCDPFFLGVVGQVGFAFFLAFGTLGFGDLGEIGLNGHHGFLITHPGAVTCQNMFHAFHHGLEVQFLDSLGFDVRGDVYAQSIGYAVQFGFEVFFFHFVVLGIAGYSPEPGGQKDGV